MALLSASAPSAPFPGDASSSYNNNSNSTNSGSLASQHRFQLENNIVTLADELDALKTSYSWSEDEEDKLRKARPWKTDANWFRKVRISGIALIKMVRTDAN